MAHAPFCVRTVVGSLTKIKVLVAKETLIRVSVIVGLVDLDWSGDVPICCISLVGIGHVHGPCLRVLVRCINNCSNFLTSRWSFSQIFPLSLGDARWIVTNFFKVATSLPP